MSLTKSTQPFFLASLNNRIKKCSGMLFRDSNESAPDIVLGHSERDWFPNSGQWRLGKLQNKYFHVRKSCILQRCPLYKFPEDILMLQVNATQPLSGNVRAILRSDFDLEVF